MKKLAAIFALTLLAASVPGWAAIKACDTLKNEIEARLKDKNVATYTLEVVDTGKGGARKVVGSCEGGKKQVVYTKK